MKMLSDIKAVRVLEKVEEHWSKKVLQPINGLLCSSSPVNLLKRSRKVRATEAARLGLVDIFQQSML